MIRNYFSLTKPGIIFGNAITATGGFFLAAKGHISLLLFLAMLLGLSLIIASACVFNNYIDRDIDRVMARTKHRALASGLIAGGNALIFGVVLGLLGTFTLLRFTNVLTLMIALTGWVFYVVVYTYSKRKTSFGAVIGSISGAVPPVVGYVSVMNRLDMGAIILFLILVLWQMPHFYAIAIYRMKDYSNASIPVLPIKKGLYHTKLHVLIYILAFLIVTALLTVFGYTGYVYLAVAILIGLSWFGMGLKGFKTNDNVLWGKRMFRFSLIIIIVLCFMMSINASA